MVDLLVRRSWNAAILARSPAAGPAGGGHRPRVDGVQPLVRRPAGRHADSRVSAPLPDARAAHPVRTAAPDPPWCTGSRTWHRRAAAVSPPPTSHSAPASPPDV